MTTLSKKTERLYISVSDLYDEFLYIDKDAIFDDKHYIQYRGFDVIPVPITNLTMRRCKQCKLKQEKGVCLSMLCGMLDKQCHLPITLDSVELV